MPSLPPLAPRGMPSLPPLVHSAEEDGRWEWRAAGAVVDRVAILVGPRVLWRDALIGGMWLRVEGGGGGGGLARAHGEANGRRADCRARGIGLGA